MKMPVPKPLDIPLLRKFKYKQNPACRNCIHLRVLEIRQYDGPLRTCGLHGGYWKLDDWCCDYEEPKDE